MLANAAVVFDQKVAKAGTDDFEAERQRLHAKIGQQAVELDWLAKKSKQLGL
jgi:signal transduction protein with GAF and PtsI domain